MGRNRSTGTGRVDETANDINRFTEGFANNPSAQILMSPKQLRAFFAYHDGHLSVNGHCMNIKYRRAVPGLYSVFLGDS